MVIDDIRDLLDAPYPAAAESFLERVDKTLTDGYAHALRLEAERWRMERRIAEILASLPTDADLRTSDELVGLAELVTSANERIAALRTLLCSLRERRAAFRAAA